MKRLLVARRLWNNVDQKKLVPGAVLIALLLTAAEPAWAIDTVWDFGGGLNASSGTATMSYRGDMGSQASFYSSEHDLGLPMPFGDHTGVMRFPGTTPSQGLTVNLNNGGATVGNYTLMWNVFRPAPSWDSWMSLYQTDVTNSNDGEFFINPTNDGIGIDGTYHGTVANASGNIVWNRIAVTRSAGGTMKKYIDGTLVGTQTASDARFDITGGSFDIFRDNDNETSRGFISSFRFVDSVMDQADIENLGGVHAGGTTAAGQGLAGNPATVTPGSFTIAILPDTQNYSSGDPAIFAQQTQWLVDNKAARNIQFVIHDGDIVNSAGSATQWNNAMAAMTTLDGELPYAVVRGNHDLSTMFDDVTRFGPGSPYSQQATLKGSYASDSTAMRNTYHTFEAGGQKFLVLAVDLAEGSVGMMDWAKQVVQNHPDHRVILNMHAYMYDGGMWFNDSIDPGDPGARTYDVVRDELLRVAGDEVSSNYNGHNYGGFEGKELWDQLASQYSNFALVIAGHQFEDFDTFKYHLTEGVEGNDVYQMLVNTQNVGDNGDGWLRLLEFDPDGKTVHMKAYSPYLNQWSTEPDVYFDIELGTHNNIFADCRQSRLIETQASAVVAGEFVAWFKYGAVGTLDCDAR